MSRHPSSFLAVLLLAGCAWFPALALGQDAGKSPLLKLIPEPLPQGAVAQPPALYTADTLYEYIDGGADIFQIYGVRQVLHLDLHVAKADLTLDIFDMGSSENAFGMYAADREPVEPYLVIGSEGYHNTGALNFLQDRYYVKLTGFGEGSDAQLEPLARAVAARIGPNPAFPALLLKLPTENRLPHTEQYMPNEPLGHPFLTPAYVAAYRLGGKEIKLYVTPASDAADAKNRLQQLEQHFTKSGKSQAAPEIGEGAIRASNSYEGTVLALTSGRYLILVLNPGPGAEELLKKAASTLK